jgi:hypothetical protein
MAFLVQVEMRWQRNGVAEMDIGGEKFGVARHVASTNTNTLSEILPPRSPIATIRKSSSKLDG